VENRTSEVKRWTCRQDDPTSLVQQCTSPQERCTPEVRVRTELQEHWTMEVGDEGVSALGRFHQALKAGGLKSGWAKPQSHAPKLAMPSNLKTRRASHLRSQNTNTSLQLEIQKDGTVPSFANKVKQC